MGQLSVPIGVREQLRRARQTRTHLGGAARASRRSGWSAGGAVGGSIAALQSPFDHQWEMQDICRGPAENITLNSSRVSSRGVLRVYLLKSMCTAGPRPA